MKVAAAGILMRTDPSIISIDANGRILQEKPGEDERFNPLEAPKEIMELFTANRNRSQTDQQDSNENSGKMNKAQKGRSMRRGACTGDGRDFPEAKTLKECKKKCKEEDSCRNFSWSKEQKLCRGFRASQCKQRDGRTGWQSGKVNKPSKWSFSEPDKKLLRWDASQYWVRANLTVKYGWLRVPLLHKEDIEEYNVQHVCLRVAGYTKEQHGATKSKRGVLLMHCGGPGSGRECFYLDPFFTILESYDVVAIDQRGLDVQRSHMSENPAPPDCPFNADTSGTKVKPYPGIYCNELWQNQDKNAVARLLELAPDSQDFTQIVLPMLQSGAKMSSASNGLMERNETLVRWWYRLVKLEYQLCYNAERYQLTGLTSGRKRSAFDFMGTVDFVYDIDIFRQALGQRKLSCWGLSYGTRVCGTYATIFPGRVSRMILDGNMDPRPDVLSFADEVAWGSMAVFRGIAAACEASVGFNKTVDDICPLAPFMAQKIEAAVTGEDKQKAYIINGLFDMWSREQDVPCAPNMMSCMGWLTSTDCQSCRPRGCQLEMPSTSSLTQMTGSLDGLRSPDRFNMAMPFAVLGVDVHGRLTEEDIISWWSSAKTRYIFGLWRALWVAIGVSAWPALPRPIPPTGDSKLRPLIIGNLRDLQTSFIASQMVKQGFPQGHLLTYQGYGHGVLPLEAWSAESARAQNYGAYVQCHKLSLTYLLTGALPDDGQTCSVAFNAKVTENEAMSQLAKSKCNLSRSQK